MRAIQHVRPLLTGLTYWSWFRFCLMLYVFVTLFVHTIRSSKFSTSEFWYVPTFCVSVCLSVCVSVQHVVACFASMWGADGHHSGSCTQSQVQAWCCTEAADSAVDLFCDAAQSFFMSVGPVRVKLQVATDFAVLSVACTAVISRTEHTYMSSHQYILLLQPVSLYQTMPSLHTWRASSMMMLPASFKKPKASVCSTWSCRVETTMPSQTGTRILPLIRSVLTCTPTVSAWFLVHHSRAYLLVGVTHWHALARCVQSLFAHLLCLMPKLLCIHKYWGCMPLVDTI